MKLLVEPGATSVSVPVFIQDSTSTTGAGKTGLAYNSSGLTAYYVRPGSASAAITLATQTVTGAWSSGGFVEIDATNMPGWYRLDVPDAVVASGKRSAGIHIQGVSGMAPLPLEIDLCSSATYFADSLLNRDMSTGTDSGSSTVRTVRQALRFLRNKWALAAGTLTVYKEDDSTSSWTASVSTDAAAVPVIGNDPAGP